MTAFRIGAVLAFAAGAAGCGVFGGGKGLAGFALGLAASAFNLWALRAIVGLGARHAQSEETVRVSSALIVIAFFAKLPAFVLLGGWAWRIAGAAPTCFLVALGLVYSAFVGWALAKR